MKNKRKFRKALARLIWIFTAFVICVSAVLYQRGVFDFSFHIRDRGTSRDTSAVTDAPVTDEVIAGDDTPKDDEKYALQFAEALRAATNIANVGAGILQGGEAVKFEFDDLNKLTSEGYELTYADFDAKGGMRLCVIDVDIKTQYNNYETYELYFYSEAIDNYHIPEGKRKIVISSNSGVRLYMGYVIEDNGEVQIIYTSTGEKVFEETTNYLIPALTRDKDNNPLFFINDYRYEGRYYYLDAENKLAESDYNDATDNRGLYFDYVPTYGLPDNDINVYNAIISIKTEITSEIPQTEPAPAPETEPVTDVIPETSEAEGGVTVYTEEITEPPAEDTEQIPADGTSEVEYTDLPVPEDTAVPETTADEIGTEQVTEAETAEEHTTEAETTEYVSEEEYPDDEIWDEEYSDDEIWDEEYSDDEDSLYDYEPVNETLPAVVVTEEPVTTEEPPAAEVPETTEAPETTEEPQISEVPETTEAPETTESPETTEEPVTTEPPPQYVVVDTIYSDELRFAYGYSEWYKITNYTYKEAYAFSEHYAAVVYPDNVMLFINEYGKIDYYLYRETHYVNPNGRRAFSIYTAPIVRGVQSVGSLYFDHGYVRVRQLDTDKIYGNPDWIVGEYDYLIDDYGRKFGIPADYDLIGYSDGILLLERDGLYGYYSIEGRWIAQPIFTFARPFAEGLGVIGFENGIKGVIDTEGNVVIPFEYTEISQVSTGIIAAYNGQWNFYGKVAKIAE